MAAAKRIKVQPVIVPGEMIFGGRGNLKAKLYKLIQELEGEINGSKYAEGSEESLRSVRQEGHNK